MNFDIDTLYGLLPAVYRIRDEERGSPLKGFLDAIASQATLVNEDLGRLYDNHFIETCEPWVIPYIADLVGCRLPAAGREGRAVVANTIAYRRRKGTATVLEQLARDVTGQDARAVEFFQRLAVTQHMNHIRLAPHATLAIRATDTLLLRNSAFDAAARTADVRAGRVNLPNVGLYLHRLKAFQAASIPVQPVAPGDRRVRLHPLGVDTVLFQQGSAEETVEHLAEPANVSMPLGRRYLRRYLSRLYGPESALFIRAGEHDVAFRQVAICNLSDRPDGTWGTPDATKYAVDPELGRMRLPEGANAADIRVSFYYGLSDDIGGRAAAPAEIGPSPASNVWTPAPLVRVAGVFRLEQSTLLPGRTELHLEGENAQISIEKCILGALKCARTAQMTLKNCIIDAGSPDVLAIQGGRITLFDCTVIGKVRAHAIEEASNTIFLSPLYVDDHQRGCMRFCWVPPGSRAPRQYRCEPGDAAVARWPRFTSLRYGQPGYCQLSAICPNQIFEGADDGGSMGAFHGLAEPLRYADLRERLREYSRVAMNAGIIYS